MAPRIKICGLKDAATIALMDGLPIHEIGFVFAPSKRQVEPEAAAALIEAAHRLRTAGGLRPLTVGVFVNPELGQLKDTVNLTKLDIVQLHGQEPLELLHSIKEELPVKLWKVFSIGREDTLDQNLANDRLAPYKGIVDAVLIDTAGGGTGQTFDWEAVSAYRAAAAHIGVPLYVAGGLHADNVGQLLVQYKPDGIDVSSGVETDGIKDIDKIRLFVRRVME